MNTKSASKVLTSLIFTLVHGFLWILHTIVTVLTLNQWGQHEEKRAAEKLKSVKDIPGPWPSLPLLGTRWIFSPILGSYTLPQLHVAYRDLFEKFGDIIKEEAFGNVPVVSIRSALDIENFLKDNPKYPIRPTDAVSDFYRKTRPDRYCSAGLVNTQGEEWSILRKHLTPELMSAHTLRSFLPELNSVSDDFVFLIDEKRDAVTGLVDNVNLLATDLGLESTCVLMLGQRFGFLEREINPRAMRLKAAVKDHMHACRDSFYGLPYWKVFPTPTYRKLMKAEETLYEIISELIDPIIETNENTCPVDGVQSVLMNILRRETMDIREKKAGIIDFVAAGIPTIGNTFTILLHQIASNPKVQARLYEELSKLNVENDQPLTVKDLQGATYLQACVKESYRVLPTASIIARVSSCDLVCSGYHLPAGTVLLCHFAEACNDERYFVRANEFLPERWIPEEAAGLGLTPQYPFLCSPFGLTRRICPGKRFSELQIQLLLAKIIRRYEVSTDCQLNINFEFVLTPSGSVPIKFHNR